MKLVDFRFFIFLILMILMLVMSVFTNDVIKSNLFSSFGLVSGLLFAYNSSKETNS